MHAPPCQPHAAAAALTSPSPPAELSPLLQWIAGTEPPAYVEVGPYAFATSEVRYDMKYDKDWNQVRQMCQGASSTPGSAAGALSWHAAEASVGIFAVAMLL